MAHDAPTLERVGPVDVGVQRTEHRVDVASVERRVQVAQQRHVIVVQTIVVHGKATTGIEPV